MKKVLFILLSATFLFTVISVSASEKSKNNKTIIYVKNFSNEEGISRNDPVLNQIKELIQEEFEKDGHYYITADEDISAIIKQEEKAQSLGKCSSESCIQELMEKINAQIIIFGRARKVDGFTYITARYMDKSTGAPRVTKIRTIKYRYNDSFEKGVRALSDYLITGDDDEVKDFMNEVYTREELDVNLKNNTEKTKLENEKQQEYNKMIEQAAKDREKSISSRSPVLRFGYGFYMSAADNEINDSFTEQSGYFADWVFGNNSIMDDHLMQDFYLRFTYKTYGMNDSSITENGTPGLDVINKSEADLFLFDFGFRIKAGKYFMMTSFEPYLLAAVRTGYYKETAEDKYDSGRELEIDLFGWGGYVGAGLELAFFENVGFFTEFNTGIFKLGDDNINFEGNQIYGGVTLRTL